MRRRLRLRRLAAQHKIADRGFGVEGYLGVRYCLVERNGNGIDDGRTVAVLDVLHLADGDVVKPEDASRRELRHGGLGRIELETTPIETDAAQRAHRRRLIERDGRGTPLDLERGRRDFLDGCKVVLQSVRVVRLQYPPTQGGLSPRGSGLAPESALWPVGAPRGAPHSRQQKATTADRAYRPRSGSGVSFFRAAGSSGQLPYAVARLNPFKLAPQAAAHRIHARSKPTRHSSQSRPVAADPERGPNSFIYQRCEAEVLIRQPETSGEGMPGSHPPQSNTTRHSKNAATRPIFHASERQSISAFWRHARAAAIWQLKTQPARVAFFWFRLRGSPENGRWCRWEFLLGSPLLPSSRIRPQRRSRINRPAPMRSHVRCVAVEHHVPSGRVFAKRRRVRPGDLHRSAAGRGSRQEFRAISIRSVSQPETTARFASTAVSRRDEVAREQEAGI